MIKRIEKYPLLSICLFVAIMLLPNLELIQVSIMEARNFISAREMVIDGNWFLTTMNGEARYEKPPLPTWLTALSSLIFGVKSVFGMRFITTLMIMLLGSYIYLFSNKILNNKWHSIQNALIAISSFYVIGITLEAPWDIYTHSFMLIAIYHLFQNFAKEVPKWRHTFIAAVCIGFSILSKGPISFYALLLPFLLAYGMAFKYKNGKAKALHFISSASIALIIGGWWYLYIRLEDPETFNTIINKETSNWTSYNVRPFYYYWSFFTQSGLWTIPAFISLFYPYLKSRVKNKKAYTFSLLWTLFAVIFLSVIPEKKSRYLMPVLIPLSINIGFYINYIITSFKELKDIRETLPIFFNFGLIALIGILFPLIAYNYLADLLTGYWLEFSIASILLSIIGVTIILQLKRKQLKSVFLLSVLFFGVSILTVLPLLPSTISSHYKPISHLREDTTLNIYYFNSISPEMIWQFGDKIPNLKQGNLSIKLPKDEQFGLLSNDLNQEDKTILKSNYNIKKITTYDLNRVAPEYKAYNNRLKSDYYILTKK